jgi:hypothetical protein
VFSHSLPVRGPHVHMYATGIVEIKVKNRMTRDASRKFRPNDAVPTMPNVTLGQMSVSRPCVSKGPEAYGKGLQLMQNHKVKMLK